MCWHGSTVEQLTCNQQVVGSIPIASYNKINMEEFPSGQRGQTVNLLSSDFDGPNPSPPTKGYVVRRSLLFMPLLRLTALFMFIVVLQ